MTKPYSPKEFLKQRRPESFSDSEIVDTPILDRAMFEYFLDTLTSRSEEVPFESFARELAKRELCPNILPHTGPTGGGDSKVDAETYPVADDLSLIWHVGMGREAATDRWAFAFSAKADWRAKVPSDVKKIAGTKRGYTKAFFITNQFVRDKTRAEVEDGLREKHGLDVRILDRTWIMDKVFANHHELLAIEQLGIPVTTREEVKKGPRDAERERELTELEAAITTATREGRFTWQLVDDCISTAQVARNMERPRTEVEGFLARAARVAKEHGTDHQQLVAAYERAKTAYWYFEDYEAFIETYPTVEALALGSVNAHDLELLNNLWLLLRTAIAEHFLDAQAVAFEEKTAVLTAELKRLTKESTRPSAALQARTMLLYHRLFDGPIEERDAVLDELRDVILQSQGLAGYPLKSCVQIIRELGAVIGERPAYERLFETVIDTITKHDGDIAAARLLCVRGGQHMLADRNYDAIRIFGRALSRLYKHESREDLIRALYLCGLAYEHVGLLWAARGTTLAAAALATDKFYTYSEITDLQARGYSRMKWLELQLGRLPQILTWHELDLLTQATLNVLPQEPDEEDINFNAILGMLFLRASTAQLRQLTTLPDVLDNMHLPLASGALLFALGHDAELPDDFGEEPIEFFQRWLNQPVATSIPQRPELYDGETAVLTSNIAGCRFTVEASTAAPCVDVAESVLAAIESLLSTAMVEGTIAREPTLTMRVTLAEDGELAVFEMADHEGRPHVEVRCTEFHPHKITPDDQQKVKATISDLLVHVLARVFFIENIEETLTKLFRDEQAIDRAINFTSSLVVAGNILGDKPKTLLASWKGEKEYALKRTVIWSDGIEQPEPEKTAKTEPKLGEGEPPAELEDWTLLKHTDIETESLIRVSLWDRAAWNGTGFAAYNTAQPPILAFIFHDHEAAIEIFKGLKKDIGSVDAEERLRISILRGVSKEDPLAYTVIVGSNIPHDKLSPEKLVIMVSRVNTMYPASDANLARFLKDYAHVGAYYLMPAVMRNDAMEILLGHSIGKRELHVRDAWQVGRHDPDSAGIHDDPIIPIEHEGDAPVLELLRARRDKK